MRLAEAIGSGITGAVALTVMHESLKRFAPNAPRMDLVGMNLVRNARETMGDTPFDRRKLYNQALAGDLISNSLIYSLAGTGRNAWWRGGLIGAALGTAAVLIPRALNYRQEASSATPGTSVLTIGMYSLAGLAAGAIASLFDVNSGYRPSDIGDSFKKTTQKIRERVGEAVSR